MSELNPLDCIVTTICPVVEVGRVTWYQLVLTLVQMFWLASAIWPLPLMSDVIFIAELWDVLLPAGGGVL